MLEQLTMCDIDLKFDNSTTTFHFPSDDVYYNLNKYDA